MPANKTGRVLECTSVPQLCQSPAKRAESETWVWTGTTSLSLLTPPLFMVGLPEKTQFQTVCILQLKLIGKLDQYVS